MKKKFLMVITLCIMFIGINVDAASVKELNLEKVEGVKLTEGIDTYNSAQSIVVTDKYLVVMLTDTTNDNKNALYIFKNNNGNFSYYKTIKNRHFGHGNDMTYNSKTNEIVIVNANKVVVLNANNFKQKREVPINATRTNIAYDSNSDSYYLGSSSVGLYNYNANFKNLGNTISSSNYRGNQGISVYSNKLYVCNYIFEGILSNYSNYGNFGLKESLIFKYNKKGKLKKIYHVDSSYKELESISFWNNTPYLLFQRGGRFKVYKATNLISSSNGSTDESEDAIVSSELIDNNPSILTDENQANINEAIAPSIPTTDTTTDTTTEIPTAEESIVTSEEVEATTDIPTVTNEEVPTTDDSTSVVSDTTSVQTYQATIYESTASSNVSENTNVTQNNNTTQIQVYEGETKVKEKEENIEEVVVEVPNTKSNNIYFTIIGLLTIISGIIFQKKCLC